jgi:hypothetical protein
VVKKIKILSGFEKLLLWAEARFVFGIALYPRLKSRGKSVVAI